MATISMGSDQSWTDGGEEACFLCGGVAAGGATARGTDIGKFRGFFRPDKKSRSRRPVGSAGAPTLTDQCQLPTAECSDSFVARPTSRTAVQLCKGDHEPLSRSRIQRCLLRRLAHGHTGTPSTSIATALHAQHHRTERCTATRGAGCPDGCAGAPRVQCNLTTTSPSVHGGT